MTPDLPIRDLAGYRKKGNHDSDPIIFYTFPATFEQEIARGLMPNSLPKYLKNAGMLTPPTSGEVIRACARGWRQIRVYVLNFMAEESSQPEE
jgi:putative DNA primase/helicase